MCANVRRLFGGLEKGPGSARAWRARLRSDSFFSYNLEGSGALFDRCTFRNNDMADSPGGGTGILFADPELLPLVDNGGPTETLALPEGSPAIDIGSGCPERDQRGEPRTGECDSGAFESAGPDATPGSTSRG